MAQFNIKAKPLVKDEVVLLLELISKKKVLTSKCTNATSNRLKDEAWKSIAREFSAKTGATRRPDQLRLKWENLKKSARKRRALLKQNNLKIESGEAFISTNEVLDRVASLLSHTRSGSTAEFSGDRTTNEVDPVTSETIVEVLDVKSLPELPQAVNKREKLTDEALEAQRDKDRELANYFRAKTEKIRLENIKLELEIKKIKSKC